MHTDPHHSLFQPVIYDILFSLNTIKHNFQKKNMFSLVLCIYQTFYLFFSCRINCSMLINKHLFFHFYIFYHIKVPRGIGYNCQINHPLFIILFLNGIKTIQIIFWENILIIKHY